MPLPPHLFQSFRSSFAEKNLAEAFAALKECFELDEVLSLRLLYESSILHDAEFLRADASVYCSKTEYHYLFSMLRAQTAALEKSAEFLQGLSKTQLLQGAANVLERRNAQLKYNAKWGVKFLGISESYLETERQNIYISSVGIPFQQILERHYTATGDVSTKNVQWNLDTEEQFLQLFMHTELYNEINDIIERHVYFGWTLEATGENHLHLFPPPGRKEGTLEADFLKQLKTKAGSIRMETEAKLALFEYYQNVTPRPTAYRKYLPDETNKPETEAYLHLNFMRAGETDLKVELELQMMKRQYFPGSGIKTGITLQDGAELNFRDTFDVLAILSILSRMHVEKADHEYTSAVAHYSRQVKDTSASTMIDVIARMNRGNSYHIRKSIAELYSEEVEEVQQYIIWQSRSKIDNENCLLRLNYSDVVRMIQLITQFEKEYIDKVISLFVYDHGSTEVSRTPFFRIGEEICWLPNTFGWTSFAESLMENVVSKKLVTLHDIQTQLFEGELMNAFQKAGYAVIKDPQDKKIPGATGKLGDFDLLAYKDGHLVHGQLKISQIRNRYADREIWLRRKLHHAAEQIRTGNEFIAQQPDHIRDILGLAKDAPIAHVHPLIIGNQFLFDHEHVDGILKVSFYELVHLLLGDERSFYDEEDYLQLKILEIIEQLPWIKPPVGFREWAEGTASLDLRVHLDDIRKFVNAYAEPLWPTEERNPALLMKHLNENRLFRSLEKFLQPFPDYTFAMGDYTISMPMLVMQTIGVRGPEEE